MWIGVSSQPTTEDISTRTISTPQHPDFSIYLEPEHWDRTRNLTPRQSEEEEKASKCRQWSCWRAITAAADGVIALQIAQLLRRTIRSLCFSLSLAPSQPFCHDVSRRLAATSCHRYATSARLMDLVGPLIRAQYPRSIGHRLVPAKEHRAHDEAF